jgi:iron uptake system component EfeO
VQTLQIHNASTSTVEEQLEDPVNGAVYAQIEGIGPGTTRSMPVSLGSGQYSFSCSGRNYGARIGPVIHVPGRIEGGHPVPALTEDQLNSITAQAHAYVADGLATLVPQPGALAADIRKGDLRQPGTRG